MNGENDVRVRGRIEELLNEIELNDHPPCFPLLLELRRAEGKLKVCGCNDDRKRGSDGGKFVLAGAHS